MRQLRYIDYDCPSCGNEETRFVYFDTETDLPIDPEVCNANQMDYEGTTCDGVLAPREISGAPLVAPLAGKDVKTNIDDANRQRERLTRRSDEHFHKRGGRDEAIERERSMLKKNGMDGSGGVW